MTLRCLRIEVLLIHLNFSPCIINFLELVDNSCLIVSNQHMLLLRSIDVVSSSQGIDFFVLSMFQVLPLKQNLS